MTRILPDHGRRHRLLRRQAKILRPKMPVEFKDYYATLGIARDATDDDVKKAFRGLARRYHPDVAKDKRRPRRNSRRSTKRTRS